MTKRDFAYVAAAIVLALSFDSMMRADLRQLCASDGTISEGCR